MKESTRQRELRLIYSEGLESLTEYLEPLNQAIREGGMFYPTVEEQTLWEDVEDLLTMAPGLLENMDGENQVEPALEMYEQTKKDFGEEQAQINLVDFVTDLIRDQVR